MQSKNSCGSKYYLNVSMTANNLKTLQKPICCHTAYRNVCSLVEPCDRASVCCMCIRDSPALDLGVFSELLTAVYELCLKLFIGQSETRKKTTSVCFLWLIYKFSDFIEDSVLSIFAHCFVWFVHWWASMEIPQSLADNSLPVDIQPKTLAKYLTSLPACDLWESEASCV